MAGTLTGQFVMEGFLQLHVKPWLRTLMTRLIAIVPSMCVAFLFSSSLDSLDEWLNVSHLQSLLQRYGQRHDNFRFLQVFQSLQLPFALLPLLYFAGCPEILGKYKLGPKVRIGAYTFD